MDDIVTVKNLRKVFKVNYKEKEGLRQSLKSLYKRNIKTVVAIDNISFSIKKGEIHGLIGPNGAGKSTTIKILAGILHPTEGEVNVMGFVPWKDRLQYVKNIGVIFGQKGQLTWELPAIDTFYLYKEIFKIPAKRFSDNVNFFIETFNIQEIVKKPVRNLSLGERMKCEIICALLHEPQLVFLDEPTIGLDIISKDIVRTFIKKINKELGITFILTTHDLNEIENLCNLITIINHGNIVYNDSLSKLRTQYSNKKIVEVTFSEQINQDRMNGFDFELTGPNSGKILLDMDKCDFHTELSHILKVLPIKDMDINSVDIETVIKNIYQQKEQHLGS